MSAVCLQGLLSRRCQPAAGAGGGWLAAAPTPPHPWHSPPEGTSAFLCIAEGAGGRKAPGPRCHGPGEAGRWGRGVAGDRVASRLPGKPPWLGAGGGGSAGGGAEGQGPPLCSRRPVCPACPPHGDGGRAVPSPPLVPTGRQALWKHHHCQRLGPGTSLWWGRGVLCIRGRVASPMAPQPQTLGASRPSCETKNVPLGETLSCLGTTGEALA